MDDNHEMPILVTEWMRVIDIVKRVATQSCCLCRDECLSCDAHDVLKELGIEK